MELNSNIEACDTMDVPLSQAVAQFAKQHQCINANLQVILGHIYSLQGYSGDTHVGTRWDGNDLDRDVMSSDEGSTEYEDVEDVLDQVFEGVLGLTLDE